MIRVCMVTHSYFPRDPRVRKETNALLKAGHEVDVICLRDPGEAKSERSVGLEICRLPISRNRASGKLGYLLEYLKFFMLAFLKLTLLYRQKRFDIIHVHNIPDPLVFTALIPKIKGARVILDMHDPMPELFADKYSLEDSSLLKSLFIFIEKKCALFADQLLVPTSQCKLRLVRQGIPEQKIEVIVNTPESPLGLDSGNEAKKFIIAYHGSIFKRYALDTLLTAIALVRPKIPGIELHIYESDVDTRYESGLRDLAVKLNLKESVAFNGYLAPLSLRAMLSVVDLGVVPMRRSNHIDVAYPTKLFDYLASGIPVLVAKTPALEALFTDGSVAFYEAGSAEDLADKLLELYQQPGLRESIIIKGRATLASISWENMAKRYVRLIDGFSH